MGENDTQSCWFDSDTRKRAETRVQNDRKYPQNDRK